jgi:hypothetical protein
MMDTFLYSAGTVSTELMHFSLYAVLSYPATTSTQQTPGPVTQPGQPQITSVVPVSSQVATTTPPPTTATGEGGTPIGAIAGGVVGGCVVIGIATFAYNRYLRHRTSARVEPIQAIEGSDTDDDAHPLLREGWFLSLRHS